MNWPQMLGGRSSIQAWMNRLLRACTASQIVESRDVMPTRTPRGTHLLLKERGGAGAGTAYDFRVCRNGESVIVRPLFESDPALAEAEEE